MSKELAEPGHSDRNTPDSLTPSSQKNTEVSSKPESVGCHLIFKPFQEKLPLQLQPQEGPKENNLLEQIAKHKTPSD